MAQEYTTLKVVDIKALEKRIYHTEFGDSVVDWKDVENCIDNSYSFVKLSNIKLIDYDDYTVKTCCGNCGILIENPRYNYCPYCGAKWGYN